MKQTGSALRHFLESFERNRTTSDTSDSARQFASVFLMAQPQGAQCISRADFHALLPRRKQMFDKLGWKSTELTGVEESWLDQRYSLAKTQWRFTFHPPNGETQAVEVQSTYLIDTGTEPFQILLYLAHQNIIEVLKQRGLADA